MPRRTTAAVLACSWQMGLSLFLLISDIMTFPFKNADVAGLVTRPRLWVENKVCHCWLFPLYICSASEGKETKILRVFKWFEEVEVLTVREIHTNKPSLYTRKREHTANLPGTRQKARAIWGTWKVGPPCLGRAAPQVSWLHKSSHGGVCHFCPFAWNAWRELVNWCFIAFSPPKVPLISPWP